jgi:hypothetical protein
VSAEQLEIQAIARVKVGREAVGLGLYLGHGQVITAAHVANAALGLPPDSDRRPEGTVRLEFPLVASCPEAQASIVRWFSPKNADVATLRLDAPLSSDVSPPALSVRSGGDSPNRAGVFGFPDGAAQTGVWVECEVGHRVRGGFIQLSYDLSRGGYAIAPGWSGAPVWVRSTGSVIGLVVQANPARGVALMAPVSTLIGSLEVQDRTVGSTNWRLGFLRSRVLGSLLNSVSRHADVGFQEDCPRVKKALDLLAAELSTLDTLTVADAPLHMQGKDLRHTYALWNDDADGNRRPLLDGLVDSRVSLGKSIRDVEALLEHEPEVVDLTVDRIVGHFEEIYNLNHQKFGDIGKMVREYKKKTRR